MGTCIFNQTGQEMVIGYFRNVEPDARLTEKIVRVSHRTVHSIPSSFLDAYREARDRLGPRVFDFSIPDKNPLTLHRFQFKNGLGENVKNMVFWIQSGGIPAYTPLENTECRISNKTNQTLRITNYPVNDVTMGIDGAGTVNVELLQGKSRSLKFFQDIDWNAGIPREQLEFHFLIDGHEPIKWPLDKFKGNKEYVCQIGPDGFEIKATNGHCRSCWPFMSDLLRQKPGPLPLSPHAASSSRHLILEVENDDRQESETVAAMVEGGMGGREKEKRIEEVPVVVAALPESQLTRGFSTSEGPAIVATMTLLETPSRTGNPAVTTPSRI